MEQYKKEFIEFFVVVLKEASKMPIFLVFSGFSGICYS